MSKSELQRFAAAVQAEPSLLDTYKEAAGPAALGALLRSDGYDVTDAEVAGGLRQALDPSTGDLSDDQLDGVSGGMFSPEFLSSLQAAIARRRGG